MLRHPPPLQPADLRLWPHRTGRAEQGPHPSGAAAAAWAAPRTSEDRRFDRRREAACLSSFSRARLTSARKAPHTPKNSSVALRSAASAWNQAHSSPYSAPQPSSLAWSSRSRHCRSAISARRRIRGSPCCEALVSSRRRRAPASPTSCESSSCRKPTLCLHAHSTRSNSFPGANMSRRTPGESRSICSTMKSSNVLPPADRS
mmetsp:Transcript_54733/g.145959  ORF Transcript_54733/g.145959 Transcript_54733/m.145959 type:complete len:203 (-) Transcript_54733:770-1378(-)